MVSVDSICNTSCFIICNVLQRIANTLRQGHVKDLQLERFVEASSDKAAELTYPALTGRDRHTKRFVHKTFLLLLDGSQEHEGVGEMELLWHPIVQFGV